FVRQLDGGEGSAVDAVATGTAADGNDGVARLGGFLAAIDGDEAHGATENERVGEVTVVEADGAIDSGNAHAVAVVAHPGDDAVHDFLRMQHAGRQSLGGRVGRG